MLSSGVVLRTSRRAAPNLGDDAGDGGREGREELPGGHRPRGSLGAATREGRARVLELRGVSYPKKSRSWVGGGKPARCSEAQRSISRASGLSPSSNSRPRAAFVTQGGVEEPYAHDALTAPTPGDGLGHLLSRPPTEVAGQKVRPSARRRRSMASNVGAPRCCGTSSPPRGSPARGSPCLPAMSAPSRARARRGREPGSPRGARDMPSSQGARCLVGGVHEEVRGAHVEHVSVPDQVHRASNDHVVELVSGYFWRPRDDLRPGGRRQPFALPTLGTRRFCAWRVEARWPPVYPSGCSGSRSPPSPSAFRQVRAAVSSRAIGHRPLHVPF